MQNNLVFVSVVGTQIFGTLGALMALVSRYGPVEIRLLYTEKTRSVAERLVPFIAGHNLGEAQMIYVGTELGEADSAPEIAREIAEKCAKEGKRVCFNLDGSLNYLIVACVLAIEEFKPLYIQSTRERVVLTDARNEQHEAIRLPPPLLPGEVLQLQGVECTADLRKNPDEFTKLPLDRILKYAQIRLPVDHLKNVKIDNYVFDYVWNDGSNRLRFLKDWRFASQDGERKDRDRDFAHWAIDRRRCGDLYDKSVYAVVWGRKTEQRLNEFSGGKIQTIFFMPEKNASYEDLPVSDTIRKIFNQKTPKVREDTLNVPQSSGLDALQDKTLVTCVGKSILSTVIAIRSHKPRHVVLLYTRNTPEVQANVDLIKKYAGELGAESVQSADFKIEGIYADAILPQAVSSDARIIVNIAPGSKGQGAMLARWALKNGYEVWSIDSKNSRCAPLLAPQGIGPVPIRLCDPLLLYRLLGREIHNEGISEKELANDALWLDGLLAFMQKADNAGLKIDDKFMKANIRIGQDELKRLNAENWLLILDGKEYQFAWEGKGAWFEKLCARSLIKAGANNVRLNLALKWSDRNSKAIQEHKGEASHSLEMDVVGAYHGNLVMISAKSYPLKEIKQDNANASLDEAVTEARNVGASLDKFVLAFVAHMGGAKKIADDRVKLVSWRDLCWPKVLAAHIEELHSNQSTTK